MRLYLFWLEVAKYCSAQFPLRFNRKCNSLNFPSSPNLFPHIYLLNSVNCVLVTNFKFILQEADINEMYIPSSQPHVQFYENKFGNKFQTLSKLTENENVVLVVFCCAICKITYSKRSLWGTILTPLCGESITNLW